MQTVHRQFGKFMKRSADESQVSVLLKDFDQADKLLTRIIDSTKAWRDAWSSVLTYQYRLLNEFEALYVPIIGSSDPAARHQAVPTPQSTLARTSKLREEYDDLRKDLLLEIGAVDTRMIRPAMQAKDYLQPIKKTIKKREDKKLDFELYQGRVDNCRKKTKRSDRDNAVLVKAEADLAKAKAEYNASDDHVRQHLPKLIAVTFSILPHLLSAQIEIQNTLLGHYYTILRNYSEQQGFPFPSPPVELVIQSWETDFLPVQQEVECFSCVAHGKTVRQPMCTDDRRNGSYMNGSGPRRPSNTRQLSATSSISPGRSLPPPEPILETKPRIRDLSPNSSPAPPGHTSPSLLSLTPTLSGSESPSNSCDPLNVQMPIAYSPAAPRADYFSRDRQPSAPSVSLTSYSVLVSGSNSTALIKKKPPPPPPPPRSSPQAVFVTALYSFGGQGPGDLAFQEGDRIRVLKKTDSTDDWWEGELHGVKGSFPANYCERMRG